MRTLYDFIRLRDSSLGFPKIGGCLFGGPHNKDYTNLGSIFGVS